MAAAMDRVTEIKKIAMIGCGSMGGGMALLFAEHGISVSLNDPSEESMDSVLSNAKKSEIQHLFSKHTSYSSLCDSLSSPKVFIFSLPHGTVGDTVISNLHTYLKKGDLIIDASNENWQNTQRRQGELVSRGVHYVGMGVSGGYQAARRGPSMCPGGEERALDLCMPLLEKVAAKDAKGRPCTGRCGMGGSGHYVKMVHNGIEHGMMAAQAEAWQIMSLGLGMESDEIGSVFQRWNEEGDLKSTFLIEIGAEICRQKDEKGNYILAQVEDKVVQDIDGSEGTGVWSSEEAIRLHVPAPTLSDAHYVRIASAFRQDRRRVQEVFGGHFPHDVWTTSPPDKHPILEDLRKAVYCAFLCSFVQGMHIIDLADLENRWQIDFAAVVQIWRNGCIIRCDHIADLLSQIYTPNNPPEDRDLLHQPSITSELKRTLPSLKKIVAKGAETNAIIPSLSASLEWLKYSTDTRLPTQFYEAQLDFFGKHMFDLRGEETGKPVTGAHHWEWRPA